MTQGWELIITNDRNKPNTAREEGKTRDMGNTGLTVLPPPERCVPHRTPSNGEGGLGALEALRDMETGQDRRPPGRRPFWEPWRSGEVGRPWRIRGLRRPWRVRGLGRPWRSRELGRPWRSRELGRPWWDCLQDRGPSPHLGLFGRSPTTPPKNFLGVHRGSIGH